MGILKVVDLYNKGGLFGYNKLKNYVVSEMSIFPLGESFFGADIYTFYNTEKVANSNVLKEEKIGDFYKVTLDSNNLYSPFIATVVNIKKDNNYYVVTFSLPTKNLTIYNILKLNVSLYQKIDVNTLIGEVDGYYYYEEN